MVKNIFKIRFILLSVVFFVLILTGLKLVEADKVKPKKTITAKEISGEVSGLGADFINVVYKREGNHDYEILIPLEKKRLSLVRKRSLQDINVGDRVSVEYEEIAEDNKGKIKTDFKAKTLTFLGPAEKKPEDDNIYQSP